MVACRLAGLPCDGLRCNQPGEIPNLRWNYPLGGKNTMRSCLKTLLILLILTGGNAAYALQANSTDLSVGSVDSKTDNPSAEVVQNGISLGEATERVRRQFPGGRIVSAKTITRGGRPVHEIKVLTAEGKVVTRRIPG